MASEPRGQERITAALIVALLAVPITRVYCDGVPQDSYALPFFLLLLGPAVNWAVGVWPRPPAATLAFGGLVLMLCAWLCLAAFWTLASDQPTADAVHLVIIAALTGILVCLLNERICELFLTLYCLVAAGFGLFVVAEFVIGGDFITSGLRIARSYLTVANFIGVAATGALVRVVVAERVPPGWGLLAGVLVLQLSFTLARGALLSTLVLVIAFAAAIAAVRIARQGPHGLLRGTARFSGILAILGVCLFLALQIERTRIRLLRFVSGTELEAGGRGLRWENALAGIDEAPVWGHGLSANGLIASGQEVDYPHQLFLQVWLDGGVPAVLLLALIVAVPLVLGVARLGVLPPQRREVLVPLLAMFCFQLLEVSKSWNLYSARFFFVFAVMVVAAAALPRQRSPRVPAAR